MADSKTADKTNDGKKNETDITKETDHQKKLNVGNLPANVTEKQLREHFSGYEIETVEIYHFLKYTLALLLFKDKETAAKALAEKEGTTFQGRRLRIHLEFLSIRHVRRDIIVTVVEDESFTEEQLWDKVKAAEVDAVSVLIFYPLGYINLAKDVDKAASLEKLNKAGFRAYDINQRDQNQHLEILRAAKLFFRNRNRVQLLNMPTKWMENEEEMKKQCACGGTITEAVSNKTAQNQGITNYARIFYETEEQAAKAAESLNGRVFDGKRIHALHIASALVPNYKTSVYVTSLDKSVTEEMVYDHFKQFGEIEFVTRRNSGDAAVVCFKSAASVEKALECTTFPATTEEKKDGTRTVTVKKYDGPLLLHTQTMKRKLGDDGSEASKEQLNVLKKLKAYHPIFVSNVPLNSPAQQLKQYFGQHGAIKFMFSPQIMAYRNSAPHPVKTFIVYYHQRASVADACKFLDHKFFDGHRLHVLPLRGESFFNKEKTLLINDIPFLSEDALFKKIKPFVGKINRIVKNDRLSAYIELHDPADVKKLLNTGLANHPFPTAHFELVKSSISIRTYDEDDTRVLSGIAKIVAKNPDLLKKTATPPDVYNKRARLDDSGLDQGPGGINPNLNLNDTNTIKDLLRLAFLSGKNVGESMASNRSPFDTSADTLANSINFGGGVGNRGNSAQSNFLNQGLSLNQNKRGYHSGNDNSDDNFRGNSNFYGGNLQQNPLTSRNNDIDSLYELANQFRGNNATQNQFQTNRRDQIGINQLSNMSQSGGNFNRNQNSNDNDYLMGNNSFGNNNRNSRFGNDNFNNDNFINRNDNFSQDNFGSNNRNTIGGNIRNQNDVLNRPFEGNSSSIGFKSRFNDNDSQLNSAFNNRNASSRFDDNFEGFNEKNNSFNPNRQNKPFNSTNQGDSDNFNFNRGKFVGKTNDNFNSNSNTGGMKWNNSSGLAGSRLVGNIFSRRY